MFQKLKLTLFSNKTRDFFINLVENTMKERDDNNIIRQDVIHLLMKEREGKRKFMNLFIVIKSKNIKR